MEKLLWDLNTRPPSTCDIDELENMARAHESIAYRYRSAVSLLKHRMKEDEERRLGISRR